MPRRMTAKSHEVILSDHAWARYCERANIRPSRSRKNKLALFLKAKLNNELARGLHLDRTGAAWLEIESLIWASARLTDDGFVVTTFTVWDKNEGVL